jgi:hypothetical protein
LPLSIYASTPTPQSEVKLAIEGLSEGKPLGIPVPLPSDYATCSIARRVVQAQVRKVKGNLYIIEIYKIETLLKIREFLKDYPLIGEKKESYLRFFEQDKFK